jgi:hypothetical protein
MKDKAVGPGWAFPLQWGPCIMFLFLPEGVSY